MLGLDDDVKGIRAAGAPLARIAASKDGGGAAGPLASVVTEMFCRILGGAELPRTLDVPGTTGTANGAGAARAAASKPAGCVGAGSELAEAESTTAREAVFDSAGAGAGATAGAGSTAAGGGCTTAGAGAGSATGAGAGSTTGAGVGSAGAGV